MIYNHLTTAEEVFAEMEVINNENKVLLAKIEDLDFAHKFAELMTMKTRMEMLSNRMFELTGRHLLEEDQND